MLQKRKRNSAMVSGKEREGKCCGEIKNRKGGMIRLENKKKGGSVIARELFRRLKEKGNVLRGNEKW